MRGLTHRSRVARVVALAGLGTAVLSGCNAGAEATPPLVPATPVVRPATPVVMFVGDSFTVGSGPVPRWETYAAETARLLGWQPVIAGAGGTGYLSKGRVGRAFQRSFEVELSWRPAPDVLVISGGHNDRRWGPARVGRAAERLLDVVRGHWPDTRIVMVGPIWLDGAPPKAYAVRDALAEVARREDVAFLDPMATRWPPQAVLPDGVHPTAAGHERIAAWLAAQLA
ncbi:SGNH/GDSL hydrolase family protein [Nonomuraea deserti]|uniref:SGNH/GDSL hydrolase family protein n=1 Tax=Nonomuraea deserti TaxID=1848322 RepID=A0A4R4V992_9ACTN|nr:SGNH/GDSL hydrolase family protein [Nonomuraea deserti]TDC99002.1 SGNH/GDSL hydrolase family protein [Nonomuraea deserti]